MCYHYALAVEAAQLAAHLKVAIPEESKLQPVYHINAYQFPACPVVTRQKPDKLQFYQWGLIPHWTKTREDADAIRARTINARSESIFEKPSFRSAIKTGKRCLIPATGFYEWHTRVKQKFPFFISVKDQPVFSFAGIWDEWPDPETGEVLYTYSMLTTDANPLLAAIHNSKQRMPCILSPENEHAWLYGNLTEHDVLTLLANRYPANKMHSHSISKLITSRSENSNVPAVMEPVNYPELSNAPALFHA